MRHSHAVLGCIAVIAGGCTDRAATAPQEPTRLEGVRALAADPFPDVIALPIGFSPEGIAAGRGSTLYVGSIPSGAIYRIDARTGDGSVLVPAQAGRFAVGMQYDARGDRLFVAGGFTGQGYVYDAATGATLAVLQLTTEMANLVNDVVVTNDAVYFTDSFRPVLYRVPLGPGGALPEPGAVEEIPLGGDYVHVANDINGNGIVAVRGGRSLILVNTAAAALYLVDPATGVATTIDLGGPLPAGDGLLLVGHTLYVVQGFLNQVAVIRLDSDFTSGTIERTITDADFAIPTTVALLGSSLYLPNGRFDVAPPPAPAPSVEFQVVRVPR
jgi:hypothetical protein